MKAKRRDFPVTEDSEKIGELVMELASLHPTESEAASLIHGILVGAVLGLYHPEATKAMLGYFVKPMPKDIFQGLFEEAEGIADA